jgi:hypothetical protein
VTFDDVDARRTNRTIAWNLQRIRDRKRTARVMHIHLFNRGEAHHEIRSCLVDRRAHVFDRRLVPLQSLLTRVTS